MTKETTAASGSQLSLPATFAFAATHIPIAALTLAVAVHMPRYFASTLGLSLAVVGAAFALVRFIDIPAGPHAGPGHGPHQDAVGRYRLWTVIGAPVLMVALYMLISAPEGVGQLYLMGWLLVMYMGFSILLLSNLAWAATLATNYAVRSRIFGVFTGLGVVGAVAVLFIR